MLQNFITILSSYKRFVSVEKSSCIKILQRINYSHKEEITISGLVSMSFKKNARPLASGKSMSLATSSPRFWPRATPPRDKFKSRSFMPTYNRTNDNASRRILIRCADVTRPAKLIFRQRRGTRGGFSRVRQKVQILNILMDSSRDAQSIPGNIYIGPGIMCLN